MPRIHFVVGYKAGSDDPEPVYCGKSGQAAQDAFSTAGENGFSTAEIFRFPHASRRRNFTVEKLNQKPAKPEKPKDQAKKQDPPKADPPADKAAEPQKPEPTVTKPGNPTEADPLA